MRTALIGAGGIGRSFARDIRNHSQGELEAIVDVSPEALESVGDEFDIPSDSRFEGEIEMYDAIDPEAVIIATPPAYHYDAIGRAFKHHSHVLCEKPVVMDLDEARGICRQANETEKTLMTGYQRHLNPGFNHARERWQAPDGSTPTFITAEFTQDWREHFEAGTNWRLDPEVGGGGHLFSVGTHVVEAVLWLTGLTPATVMAEMEFYDDENQIDKQAALTVRFTNGTVASFGDSAVVPDTRERIHIWDDDGCVSFDGEGWSQREITVMDNDGTNVTPPIDYDATPTKFGAFVDSIESGTEPPATATDAKRVTALLDAAYESARTGERVDVSTT